MSTTGVELPLLGTTVTADASGGIARVTVGQRFRNPYREPLDVTYSLPLPVDGAVSGFALHVGGARLVGVLEGRTYAEYRAWKQAHSRRDPFPGGESLDQTAARYARAFASLARNGVRVVLVVCHEIPLRYALNATAGSESLEAPVHGVPNATPFLFETGAIKRAAQAIERLAHT